MSKIRSKCGEGHHVKDNYKDSPAIGDDEQLNVLLTLPENLHVSNRQTASKNLVSKLTVHRG